MDLKKHLSHAGGVSILLLLVFFCFRAAAIGDDDTAKRRIINRSADGDAVIKILLYYDMEGLAGQNIITSIDYPRPEYFEARELLTNDVNAVIDGLFAGGADSVVVVDAHGSFNPEPDILLEEMDARARMLYKNHKFDSYVDLLEDNNYDAVVAVAMHSKTGGGGFAEHTINLGTDWIFNGMSVNESEILAYSWGRRGIPLILVTGDDKLAEQLAWMDWLEYVTVKKAKGIDDAILYPVDSVHKQMRQAAHRAVENIDRSKAVELTSPITATLRVQPPADLSILSKVPGIDYHDQSVTFAAADFSEAYDGMRGLLAAAQSGYYDIAAGLFLQQGQDAWSQFKEAVFQSWREAASGEGKAEEQSQPPSPKPERLYFGSN